MKISLETSQKALIGFWVFLSIFEAVTVVMIIVTNGSALVFGINACLLIFDAWMAYITWRDYKDHMVRNAKHEAWMANLQARIDRCKEGDYR